MTLRPALLALLLVAALAPATASASCRAETWRNPWPDCPGKVGGSSAHADRIPALHLGATPEYAGYRSHKSICSSLGDYRVSHYLGQGDALPAAHYFYAWSVYAEGVLVCGRHFEVPGHRTGPADSEGESIRCPDGLAGFGNRSEPVDVGWWVSEQRAYVQVHGSFGHNEDGFWHYRIHNPGIGAVTVQLYGICKPV